MIMNNVMKTDLIIIGSGPGGYTMAFDAASQGLAVTIFENDKLGGTCLNRGCIPTKTLCQNASIIERIKESSLYGIEIDGFKFDFSRMMARKNDIVSQLQDGIGMLLKHPNINLIHGEAEIIEDRKVKCGDEIYLCDNLVIATGSEPKFLPIEGAHCSTVLTSDEILNLAELPHKLTIIGGGVIGMEFACIFHSLGVEVSVVEFCKEILPTLDSDVAKRLRQALTKKGIAINVNSQVKGIKELDGKTQVLFEQKGKELSLETDIVLMAVGRAPRFPKGLDKIGVDYSGKGIKTDDSMQTNIRHTYAIGDVNGRCMLAHAATFQGKRALNAIYSVSDDIMLDIMPAAVFTQPEASSVGLTEDQCKADGIDFVAKKSFFRSNGKAMAMNDTDGIIKLIATKDNGIILGCHILGPHAADLIQEVTTIMNKKGTVYDLRACIHAHPTLGETLEMAADQF